MKILILGSSGSNIDLMEYCFNAGMQVHCMSLKPNRFTIAHAHRFVEHDYSDQEFIESYCIENDIDLIYSMGSDACTQMSATVSTKLKLPSLVTPETASLCADKFKRREALGHECPYNIKYKLVSVAGDLDDWNTFPCIIKPIDNQGQRGVFKARSRLELARRLAECLRFSVSGQAIVEEYIAGRESTVNCYIFQSKVYFFVMYDKMPMKTKGHWSPQQYRLPSFYKNDESIGYLVSCISQSANIHDGPLMIQIRYKNQVPKVIEYFSRPGGSHTYAFIKKYCSVDLNETLISHLKGESLPELKVHINHARLSYNLVYGKAGEVPTYPFRGLRDIKEHKAYFAEGEVVSGKGKYERIGYYIQ